MASRGKVRTRKDKRCREEVDNVTEKVGARGGGERGEQMQKQGLGGWIRGYESEVERRRDRIRRRTAGKGEGVREREREEER